MGAILFVRAKSGLDAKELDRRLLERRPRFLEVPGLLEKYYVVLKEPDHYGGIYVWEDADSLAAYERSDLASSIAAAYKVVGQPETEILDVFMPLRD